MEYVPHSTRLASGDRHLSISAIFGTLAGMFRRYDAYRTTLRELNTLDDRELRDLNLSREGLRGIARKAASMA